MNQTRTPTLFASNKGATYLLVLPIYEYVRSGVPERWKGMGAAFSKGTFNTVRTVITTNIAL